MSTLTQDQIRQQKQEIDEERQRLKDALEDLLTKSKRLQRNCSHPGLRTYSAQGDVGHICDDCGYQT